jgi:delta 1-pyrroline-5-carboxylate dehydrogenase
MGGLYNTGQDCTCGSRVYVQSSVYDKFLGIMKEKIKEYKLGDGFDTESSAGPLVRDISICILMIRAELDFESPIRQGHVSHRQWH